MGDVWRGQTRGVLFVSLLSLMIAGCASKEYMAELQAKRVEPYAAEIKAVLPHVTAAHLQICREKLETGGRWKLTGPLTPSVGSTCELSTTKLWRGELGSKYIALFAPAQGYGPTGPLPRAQRVMGCTLVLKDGAIEVRAGAPTSTPKNGPCNGV